jgi:para-aminobenzoate synthetase/4-amino-4-deoxychorismate lyase
LIHTRETYILSASPELFFRKRGSRILVRPMKGTARRGRDREEDSQRAAWLAADEKNRAENVMIVDLLRNDLGRICLSL